MVNKSLLVVIDGIDGCGKSTLAKNLVNHSLSTESRLDHVGKYISEPTNHGFGAVMCSAKKNISSYSYSPMQETMIFVLDRYDNVRDNIKPCLSQGKMVVMDRYFYSTVAYQGARGVLSVKYLLEMNLLFAPIPDLLVIPELSAKEAQHRIKEKRGDDFDVFEGFELQTKVKAIFDDIDHPNIFRVDATLSPEKMTNAVVDEILKLT